MGLYVGGGDVEGEGEGVEGHITGIYDPPPQKKIPDLLAFPLMTPTKPRLPFN